MIRAVVAAVVVLMFSATTAFALQAEPAVKVAIDVDATGNAADSLGALDVCREASVGDTFDIDVVVEGVPPLADDGLSGATNAFGFNIHFNPQVLNITAANNKLMLGEAASFEIIQANYEPNGAANPFPGTSGDTRVDFANLSGVTAFGDGVLSRLTVSVIGAGASDLTLDDEISELAFPTVVDAGAANSQLPTTGQYDITALTGGLILVGQSCAEVPTPTSQTPENTPTPSDAFTPTPAASPTPVVSSVPAGDTEVSVDAIPSGNSAAEVGEIDDCASAENGATFQVDVVIEGVEDLLAWEGPISYDPDVLKVVERDVKLFLASDGESQIIDASNQVPNDTGLYRTGAADSADPLSPNSGDGVLVRLTLEAVGTGTSPVSLAPVDLNGDSQPDTGLVLKNVDNEFIGGATFEAVNDAEIRVGSECADSGAVVETAAPTGDASGNGNDDDGGSNGWIWIVAGVVAVLAASAGAALLLRRRGSGTPS